MPRQTAVGSTQFPDGFKLEVSTDSGNTWTDVGLVSAGATATLNWDPVMINAGNYEAVKRGGKNFQFTLNPSALWSWDPDVIAAISGGVLSKSEAQSPEVGSDIDFGGSDHYMDIDPVQARMTHYSDAALTTVTWQVTVYDAYIQPGINLNFKGVNEDGLDEYEISFIGYPDVTDGYKLMKIFKAS